MNNPSTPQGTQVDVEACPWCGATPVCNEIPAQRRRLLGELVTITLYQISCGYATCQTQPKTQFFSEKKLAVERWNTRVGHLELERLIEREYADERTIDAIRAELAAAENKHTNLKDCWDQQCQHVHDACKMMGIDTDAIPADSWTLCETTQRMMKEKAASEKRAGEYRKALAELVACKDLKDKYECSTGPEKTLFYNEYRKRQPYAWIHARQALADPQHGGGSGSTCRDGHEEYEEDMK